MNNAVIWTLFASVISYMCLFFIPALNYRLSYAYLRITELKDNQLYKILQLQTALRYYDNYLNESINLRIKDIGKIQSSITINKFNNMNSKINILTSKFGKDHLEPARYLAEISGIDSDEFFYQPSHFASMEKWMKILAFLATIGSPFILQLIQTYIQHILK